MIMIIKLEGLCCANCAAKIEEEVKKVDGVVSASVSFMTQRLVLEGEEEKREAILKAAKGIAAKIEPEAEFIVLR